MLFEVTKLRIWKQLTTCIEDAIDCGELFEVTKLRIWKQLTTSSFWLTQMMSCLRSQSYEFESNSQRWAVQGCNLGRCLRSQSYEFESNSQLSHWENLNHQGLFEVTKLRIWKQLTTRLTSYSPSFGCLRSQSYEFESNSQQYDERPEMRYCCLRSQSYVFESNSQQHTQTSRLFHGCLRSQSYEFESNSQHGYLCYNKRRVVWGHKVTNLKATHNLYIISYT